MGIRLIQVDAFTSAPFGGNPAAVCLLDGPADESWMQLVAREMNLSETAFLYRQDDGFSLRWFTPEVEVDLCGHATLASAHVLFEEGLLAPGATARFSTRSGDLFATREDSRIALDFPAKPESRATAPESLLEALGVDALYVGRNAFDFLVLVDSEETVRRLAPDFSLLRRIAVRGVMVTAPATSPRFDFVSRFFAPAVGVDEDPVTGSAHCCLAPFWQARLGKSELVAYQASNRGGVLYLRVAGGRVILGGNAVTVLRGELEV